MFNILPRVKRSIARGNGDDKLSCWRPADADPATRPTSYVLRSELTKETANSNAKPAYSVNRPPHREPNQRYLERSLSDARVTTFPLKREERGVADRPEISFVPPPGLTKYHEIAVESVEALVLRIVNSLYGTVDLFVQKKQHMSTAVVKRDSEIVRLIAGTQEEGVKVEPLCFWFADAHRAVLTATSRQELKHFIFRTGQQIGLEIEVEYGRVSIEHNSSTVHVRFSILL
ncbi:hypothetical protein B484DRAFT_171156 [Ochromonadaceae sp. CCMP2298]|nr:hypothetical protein B484DRAFT_171156 [Ochromonadaceae sp. CCMP2298]